MIQLARLTSICEILEKNDFFLSDQGSYLDTITAEPRERRHIEDFAFIGDIGAFAYSTGAEMPLLIQSILISGNDD